MLDVENNRLNHALPMPPSAPYFYMQHGLKIQSDFKLSRALAVNETSAGPDVTFRRGLSRKPPPVEAEVVASVPCGVHGYDMIERRGPTGTRIWLQSAGTFDISLDHGFVDVYPDDESDVQAMELALCGPILLFLRYQRGLPSLHGSAMVHGEKAVAFLGPRGWGKSTIAASFLQRGEALLTDDIVSLVQDQQQVYALPGPPFMKVWDETLRHGLDLHEEFPSLSNGIDKKLLDLTGRYATAAVAVPLQTLYVLNRYDPFAEGRSEIIISRLEPRDALVALLGQTYGRRFLIPRDDGRALPVYSRLVGQAAVRTLQYPSGFDFWELVCERILMDVVSK